MLKAMFTLEKNEKKNIMKNAWKIFKNFFVKYNDLEKFLTFFQFNDNLLSEDVVARLASIGEGMRYLYH